MSAKSRDVNPNVEKVIDEMETRPLRGGFVVHDFSVSRDQISGALDYGRNQVELFWGIKRTIDGEVVSQSLMSKIEIIRKTLSVIPDLVDYSLHTDNFVQYGYNPDGVAKLEARKVGVELDPNIAKYFRKTPSTALEAYRTPSVRELAHTALIEIGDPATQVIDLFEQFTDSQPVEIHALEIGQRALELSAFASGGQPLVELLGSANRVFHEGEIERRKLNR